LQINLLGKGKKIKASMGRFAVFHCRKEEGHSSDKTDIIPILYSKNPNDIVLSTQLKSYLENEEENNESLYFNKICDRIINKRFFLNSVLEEEDDINSNNESKFVTFVINEYYKNEEKKTFKEYLVCW
jgi:hypothetical protein